MNHSLRMLSRFVTLLRPIMESDEPFPAADAVALQWLTDRAYAKAAA